MALSPDEKQLARVFSDGSVIIGSQRLNLKARSVEFGPQNSFYWIAHDGTVWRSPGQCVWDGLSHPAMSLRRSKGGTAMLLEIKDKTVVWHEDETISQQIIDTIIVDVHRNGSIVSLPNNDTDWCVNDMDLFVNHVVAYQRSRHDERHRFVVHSKDQPVYVSSDIIDPFTKLTPSGNMHYDTDVLRFRLEKPYQPPVTYEFNMTTHSLQPESFPRNDMIEKRIFATSLDGTQIPMALFHHPETTINRVLLLGYGAYGQPLEWSYDPVLHHLLKHGVVLAYAHIRSHNKLRGIEDYIACAQCMQSYGSVIAHGVSAGGVIVAAALQRAPDLFTSAILVHAFLDVDATLRNPDLYLTKEDWEEYDYPNPSIASYCPVSNVSGDGGPPVLVLGTMDDERVPYWNALIYTHKRGTECTHLYMEPSGGHTWNMDRQRMMALQVGFVLQS